MGELYIGELSLGSVFPEDVKKFAEDLTKVGYELREVADCEPDTYDIYRKDTE